MNFYDILLIFFRAIFYLFNGKPYIVGTQNIPKGEPVIFASTHRSMTDPFYIAFAVSPKQVSFMAKESLFNIPIVGFILRKANMFPVNREKTSTSTMRRAVSVMNEDGLNLGIFPSGSRHTTEIKGGTAFIQRLSKRDIVPVVIQPPIGFWQFITRKKAKVAFGDPIKYDDNVKYDKEMLKEIDDHLQRRFDQLDYQLNPDYKYDPSIHGEEETT